MDSPYGLDISKQQIDFVKKNGFSNVYDKRWCFSLTIINLNQGHGVDSVIITAATNSLDPVNFAGEISRMKGKLVIVGAVPTGFSREMFYKKELDLIMSSSYGPGRYDVKYEQKGQDYPLGYVRWTENRNMESFIDLLKNKRVDVKSLIS